jgi:hypothetical protein
MKKRWLNPFRYYRLCQRAKRIRIIKYDRLFRESILGMWATRTPVEMPLYELTISGTPEMKVVDGKWIYTIKK